MAATIEPSMNLILTLNAVAMSPDHAARILRAAADSIDQMARTHRPPLYQTVSGSINYDWTLNPYATDPKPSTPSERSEDRTAAQQGAS